jgi:hypothetical protein
MSRNIVDHNQSFDNALPAYVLHSGTWFESNSPSGPWVMAAVRGDPPGLGFAVGSPWLGCFGKRLRLAVDLGRSSALLRRPRGGFLLWPPKQDWFFDGSTWLALLSADCTESIRGQREGGKISDLCRTHARRFQKAA